MIKLRLRLDEGAVLRTCDPMCGWFDSSRRARARLRRWNAVKDRGFGTAEPARVRKNDAIIVICCEHVIGYNSLFTLCGYEVLSTCSENKERSFIT